MAATGHVTIESPERLLTLSGSSFAAVNVEALICCERALPHDAACPDKPWLRSVEERNGIPVSQTAC